MKTRHSDDTTHPQVRHGEEPERFIGLDVGAETAKAVELVRVGRNLRWTRRQTMAHHKAPARILAPLLEHWGWNTARGATVTGRFSRQFSLQAVPTKQAQSCGCRFLAGDDPLAVISIGSHGFSLLERRSDGNEVFRGNSRCSQGTGNFLRQLVERFNLSVEEAGELCASQEHPAPLSGRCPVILKTDMTHLANKGESREAIIAGLIDAVCENVMALVRPGVTPARVILTGGVTRCARVRRVLRETLGRHGLALHELPDDDALYLDALGAAILAAERPAPLPPLDRLAQSASATSFEKLPALSESMAMVRRMPALPPPRLSGPARPLTLGFDIGSTGSKAVALDAETGEALWEGYRSTSGAPVEAAQALWREFLQAPAGRYPVLTLGATGSGREIVGSLMATCYGRDAVYILNEIAAHAAGALHHDPEVDTIFEIGGQDAKYIRLAAGRITDCAMNEACSAGTGSFIEEQGRRFKQMGDVREMNRQALASPYGVSLGQHCSVFMAEIIEGAAAAGVPQGAIMAGLYDAVVRNYLHRVKGPRSVGQVIFCQGMPFAADALAAAVARQTGSRVVVPPNPGTVGALGIALLTRREVARDSRRALDPDRFLNARIEAKETFVCPSAKGCGGGGNRCRVDRIRTRVDGARQTFAWGGACSLYDKGARKRKLPDRAPDPFAERAARVAAIATACAPRGERPRVAITDEFALNGLFPFFATFLHEAGLDLLVVNGADQSDLKRGIREAGIPFCAPMQLYHGLACRMTEQKPDMLFLPMIREVPRQCAEPHSTTCPIVQASPDLLKSALAASGVRLLTPVVNLADGLDSREFRRCCDDLAAGLGAGPHALNRAFERAKAAQEAFDGECDAIGKRALAFCSANAIPAVVVLGRGYTIHSRVLNSNVPAILREQGAMAIPADCYPVPAEAPAFRDVYWGYGQRILRAARHIRRTPGVYSLYCSNYSCGPDSFTLHFYSHIMGGRPFTVIETDGHSGDAGTKTRVEAFLHCVEQDRQSEGAPAAGRALEAVQSEAITLSDLRQPGVRLLIPSMGPSAQALAACFRGLGVQAEALRPPDQKSLRLGRRHTSGKECAPVCMTLGSLLDRIESEADRSGRFVFLMPRSDGPCRLGVYHILQRIVLEQLGLRDRVRIWSPCSTDYFADTPAGFPALVLAAIIGMDLLDQALHDARPTEHARGTANAIYSRYVTELLCRIECAAASGMPLTAAIMEIARGRVFGIRGLLERAGRDFAAIRGPEPRPTVLLTGEIYMRSEPFASDFAADKLEARGIRVRQTPTSEWLDYVRYLRARHAGLAERLQSAFQKRLHRLLYAAISRPMGWSPMAFAETSLRLSAPYVHRALEGEAGLTVGGALAEWHHGHLDGVLSVGPLECMPNKIAEAQLARAAEQEGVLSLTLSLNGDPLESEALDTFAFEVNARFEKRLAAAGLPLSPPSASASPGETSSLWRSRPERETRPSAGAAWTGGTRCAARSGSPAGRPATARPPAPGRGARPHRRSSTASPAEAARGS